MDNSLTGGQQAVARVVGLLRGGLLSLQTARVVHYLRVSTRQCHALALAPQRPPEVVGKKGRCGRR